MGVFEERGYNECCSNKSTNEVNKRIWCGIQSKYYPKYPYRNISFTKPNKISKLVVNFTDLSVA